LAAYAAKIEEKIKISCLLNSVICPQRLAQFLHPVGHLGGQIVPPLQSHFHPDQE
jgi:hypothetical protein